MKKFSDQMITEAAYPNNIGFAEMVKFYKIATPKQLKKMEKVIKAEDWSAFKKLIKEVNDVILK